MVYKIRNKETGRFSNAYYFTDGGGKAWSNSKNLKAHLRRKNYINTPVEVVCFDEAEVISIEEFLNEY